MSSSCIWIKNGRVIDPAANRDAIGNVFIRDGIFVSELSPDELRSAKILDASDLVVAPGFIDLHARLGEPGNRARETIESAARAAAAGGFTTVVAMPDTNPPVDNASVVRLILETARNACVHILTAGAITQGLKGEALAPIGSLHQAGIVAITDGINGVQNNEIMRRALEYARMFNLVVLDHCQDASMTRNAVMHEGVTSIRLGLRGFPAAAEEIVVASDILLSKLTRARIHLQHLTSASSINLLRDAKHRGIPITAEVTPEHLLLTEDVLCDYNTNYKLAAPLRTCDDRAALIEALRDGTIDAIASDHTPVTPTEKDREFDYAPFGAIGLETAFSVALEALFHVPAQSSGDVKSVEKTVANAAGVAEPFPLSLIVDKFTRSPARILGLSAGTLAIGKTADVTIFHPSELWIPRAETFLSRSKNSPHIGRPLHGRIKTTIVSGKIIHPSML